MLGADKKKRFDAGELRSYMEMLNQCAVRQARLMGLDSPVKLGVAWTGAPLGGDVLTADQLNNLSNDELRNLFHLLDKAQHGQSVEVESHHVAEDTLNFPPRNQASDARAGAARGAARNGSAKTEASERYRPLREAEAIVAKLNVTDPTLRIGDPIVRAEMARKANKVLVDFGRRPWTEWMQN